MSQISSSRRQIRSLRDALDRCRREQLWCVNYLATNRYDALCHLGLFDWFTEELFIIKELQSMKFEGPCKLRNGLVVYITESDKWPGMYASISQEGWIMFFDNTGAAWHDKQYDIIECYADTCTEFELTSETTVTFRTK